MSDYPINRTPEHLRCPLGECPAVYELEGGKLLIVGNRATPEDLRGPVDYNIGDEEEAIVIDRALLSDLAANATDASGASVIEAVEAAIAAIKSRPGMKGPFFTKD